MFKKIAEGILILRWPILLGLILITIVTGGAMLRLQIDPSMEPMFVKNSPEYKYYKEYKEKYGSDQMIAVAMSTPGLFDYQNLHLLKTVTADFEKFPEVERVLSLGNTMDIKHKFIGIKVYPLLEGVFDAKVSLKDLKANVLGNELFVNNLISKDGKVANMLIYLKSSDKNTKVGGKFIEKLREYLESKKKPGIEFYIAGSPVEQYDFIKLIRKDQMTFVPLIAILLVITTLLIYRSIPCMIISMSIVFMTLIWTIGTIALVGQQMNLMTSLLAPVIMIVAVVNSIYLINVFFEIRPQHPSFKMAVILTIDQLGVPCLLTHLTTVLGFISLALTPVPAIQSFGIFAALGTFYSYVVEIVLTPILMPILPYRSKSSYSDNNFFNKVLIGYIEKLEFRWKWLILAVSAAAVYFSVIGIQKIEVDTNIVKQMKPDLPLAISTRFIDEHVTGVYSLGFVLRRRDGGTFTDETSLRKVDEIKTFLEDQPAISKANVITTLIKKIHMERHDEKEKYVIPDEPKDLRRYFKGITESGDPEVFKMISPDFKEIRIDARMKAVGTTEGSATEDAIRAWLDKNMSSYFDYKLTGNVVLLGKMAKDLVKQQLESFWFAFAAILLVIVILFRSWKMGLLAAIPNLLPIMAVYGLMGFMKIELSTPTAMISSIVLGLVVDASIQFLYRFRLEFEKRHHYLQSLHHTYLNTGHSMVVSTMILVVGFASSVFASFRPTIHFGALTSLTIFLALICTIIVLPVCLLILKPLGKHKLFSRGKRENLQPHPKNKPHN